MKRLTFKRLNGKVLMALILGALLGGCALSPNLDAQFGQAVKNANRRQALHDDPKLLQEDPDGLEGRAAAGIMEQYFKSYEEPPKAHAVGIGNVGGSGR
jgi:hypothetical protein